MREWRNGVIRRRSPISLFAFAPHPLGFLLSIEIGNHLIWVGCDVVSSVPIAAGVTCATSKVTKLSQTVKISAFM